MDRRKYLKTLAAGSLGAGVLISCEPGAKEAVKSSTNFTLDRTKEELIHEMKTISILADIIIPKDGTSGSATDAGVPAFIEFIVKDMPHHQTPMRGGLKWLDLQCMKRFNADFASCTSQQQIEMVDEIAYPEKAKPEMQQGVAFFNKMRDLTACGFFSSEIGIKDLGYAGNKPNQWDGVPQDVLDQYGVKYSQRELDESVKFDA
jgi:gluconate 2-dehydrogenase gamma chain